MSVAGVSLAVRCISIRTYKGGSILCVLDLARQAMDEINPNLTQHFLAVVEFSISQPNLAIKRPKTKANPEPSTSDIEHFRYLARKFNNGRLRKSLPQPQTVPDPALPITMQHGYGVAQYDLENYIEGHRVAMVAENVVGELLERYLDSVLNDEWIWCAGEVVKHVDFIQPPAVLGGAWRALQIKNRDNSENSSSGAIRNGTDILKWYRTKSRSGETMWENFPIESDDGQLSEESFQQFIQDYVSFAE